MSNLKLFRNSRNSLNKTLRPLAVWQPNPGFDIKSKYYCYLPYFGDMKHKIKFKDNNVRLHKYIDSMNIPKVLRKSKVKTENIFFTGVIIVDQYNKVLFAGLIRMVVWQEGVGRFKNYVRDTKYLLPAVTNKRKYDIDEPTGEYEDGEIREPSSVKKLRSPNKENSHITMSEEENNPSPIKESDKVIKIYMDDGIDYYIPEI